MCPKERREVAPNSTGHESAWYGIESMMVPSMSKMNAAIGFVLIRCSFGSHSGVKQGVAQKAVMVAAFVDHRGFVFQSAALE